MKKSDLEPIVKTYYDALEEGRVLGRKCCRCGHIEFPPYLCCNECGSLETEWVDMSGMHAHVKQALPTVGAFGDPDFRKAQGDYWAIEINVDGCDPLSTSLVHIDPDTYDEFAKTIREQDVTAHPVIIQDEDVKVAVWELDGDFKFKKMPEATDEAASESEPEPEPEAAAEPEAAPAAEADPAIVKVVMEAAAEAYGVDEDTLTLGTDIREDLSNQSMKMIVMISEIEDELDVTIEIQEANYLYTLGDFVGKIQEKLAE